MPSRLPQFVVRGAAVFAAFGLSSGALAVVQGAPNSDAVVAANAPAEPTTSSTAAPAPVTVPPTAPPTTAATPRPAATTPTTARPRPATTAPKPTRQSAASPAPASDPEARGQQALALINYPWQSLGYTISFEPGQQTYLGMTNSDTRVIQIYVRENESLDTLARTIGHELGHALDFSHTSDDERRQYLAIRGINATLDTWYACNGCTDYTTAAGDWAETFQYWLLGPGQYWSEMGPPPNADQLAQLAPIFAAS